MTVQKRLPLVLALLAVCARSVLADNSLGPPVKVTGVEQSHYGNAVMGGVEYATGLAWCSGKPENLFARADGGGIWRLDRGKDQWVCLTDNIPFKWRDLITVDSLAVHPQNPEVIYIAGGGRWGDLNDVLKTEDGGKTWNRLFVKNEAAKPVVSDGNGENKQAGERLVIDANAPDILFFATRNDGLLTTKDGGRTWKTVEGFPTKGKAWAGLTFVVGDFASGTPGKPTQRWYVGAQPDRSNSIRGGVIVTNDGGATWTRMDDGPGQMSATATPMRARIAPDGTVYLTTIGGGVWRGRPGDWHVITPSDARGKPFCGINYDAKDPRRIMLAQTGGNFDNTFYYSSDAGDHWTQYTYKHDQPRQSNVSIGSYPAWEKAQTNPSWGGNASDIAFDSVDPAQVWHCSFSGVCRIQGVGTDRATASLVGGGREQITAAEAISTTSGAALISGVWDVGGFRHVSLDQIPGQRIGRLDSDGSVPREEWKQHYQDIFCMDVQPANPKLVVMCGGWQWNQTGEAGYSMDNGATFRAFATKPFESAKFGRIAVSMDGSVVWAPMGSATAAVFHTQLPPKTATAQELDAFSRDQRWYTSDGAPLGMIATAGPWSFYRCLAADRARPGVFYLYDRRDGKVYRSEDQGVSFTHVSTVDKQSGLHYDRHRLEAAPWRGGELWLSLRELGLLHSSDGGNTWARLDGVRWAENFAFGKPRRDDDYPAIYLFGQIGGEKPTATTADCQLYRSEDAGKTWVQLNDPTMQFGCIAAGMAGDMQTFGRVFITTTARGIFYVEPDSDR